LEFAGDSLFIGGNSSFIFCNSLLETFFGLIEGKSLLVFDFVIEALF
jgi:hypothetical protein